VWKGSTPGASTNLFKKNSLRRCWFIPRKHLLMQSGHYERVTHRCICRQQLSEKSFSLIGNAPEQGVLELFRSVRRFVVGSHSDECRGDWGKA
jgi:hypothetical protein